MFFLSDSSIGEQYGVLIFHSGGGVAWTLTVLWYDGNDDNEFGLGDSWGWESGFFPVKTVSETEYVITGWEAAANGFVAISNSESSIDLSSEGTTGFDFFQAAY